jgi:lipooligosaccharide transport system permease protein
VLNKHSIAIVHRHYLVWRSLIWSSLASNVVNPILFLFAFGFGLGAFIDTMSGIDYIDFVVPGMAAYAAMFAASFETTIGAYSRYAMQRTWDAMLATPITLPELLFGEVMWAALKGVFSAACVTVVGAAWGGVDTIAGTLLALVLVFAGSLGFAAFGLLATSAARGYEFFSYFFTFWLTPMFVFSGVFFDVERFPAAVQALSWLLPMTHLIAVMRPLMNGLPLDTVGALVHVAYVLGLGMLAFWLALRNMRNRLFD